MLMWQHDWFNLKLFLLIQDLSQLSKFKLFGGLNAFSILLPYLKLFVNVVEFYLSHY